jgi:ribose transport system permease protein
MSSTEIAAPMAKPPFVSRAKGRVRLSNWRDYGIVAFLVALFVVLSFATDTFLTVDNLKNVVDGYVATALIALGGTIVIICGGFDLSSGAIFSVAAIVGAKVSNSVGPEAGMAVGLVAGCGMGFLNGTLCTVGKINPFVGTLGTMIAFGGLATLISGSGLVLIDDESFSNLAGTAILGFKLSTWILVVIAVLCGFLLNRTVFGQHVFGVGGNREAARLAGVPINRTLTAAFTLSGGLAAVAGLIVAARSLSVNANAGQNIIFDALAAILIGGNSILGGEGAVWRTMVGVFILALISNGFNLLGVDPLYQQIVSGTIIIVAIGADAWTRRT